MSTVPLALFATKFFVELTRLPSLSRNGICVALSTRYPFNVYSRPAIRLVYVTVSMIVVSGPTVPLWSPVFLSCAFVLIFGYATDWPLSVISLWVVTRTFSCNKSSNTTAVEPSITLESNVKVISTEPFSVAATNVLDDVILLPSLSSIAVFVSLFIR